VPSSRSGPHVWNSSTFIEDDHPRAHERGPPHGHPCQAPDALVARLTALGFAEVLAVGAEPGKPDRAALRDGQRVDVPDAFAVVLGLRVILRVHGHGLGVVVDCDVDVPTERKLDA